MYKFVPIQPSKPLEPIKPPKQIVNDIIIDILYDQEYREYSLADFYEIIKKYDSNIDPLTVLISFEINSDESTSDFQYTRLNIKLFTRSWIDNPNYDSQYNEYKEKLKKYKIQSLKYEDDMKQYKVDLKKHKIIQLESFIKNAKDELDKLASSNID